MNKYVIQYRTPFMHEVHLGIEAESEQEALQIAREQLESGHEVLPNNPLFPVLHDSLREAGGAQPQYAVLKRIDAEHWPASDDSVEALRRRHFANLAAQLLVQAFEGRRPDDCDLVLLNQARLAALSATAPHQESAAAANRIAVIIEGDVIQAVVADRPQEVSLATVEYSPDGFDASELHDITQGDGRRAQALVTEHFVEEAAIDLDEVFDPS